VPAGWGSASADVDPGVLTVLAQACRDTERVRFAYTSAAGESSSRDVEPLRLVSLGRRWYLVAYDLTRHDWRSFRLDRLDAPDRTGARFRPRELPAEDAAAFVRAGIDRNPAWWAVEVRVSAPADVVRAAVGRWGTTEDDGDARCVLRMRADTLDWPAMLLGTIGADFEVVSPPELLDHVQGWARTFDRATGPIGRA
jgi:predicted DNA-binding transcriptional regulator YafY